MRRFESLISGVILKENKAVGLTEGAERGIIALTF